MFTIQSVHTHQTWTATASEAAFWATIDDGFGFNVYRTNGNGTPLNLFEIY